MRGEKVADQWEVLICYYWKSRNSDLERQKILIMKFYDFFLVIFFKNILSFVVVAVVFRGNFRTAVKFVDRVPFTLKKFKGVPVIMQF